MSHHAMLSRYDIDSNKKNEAASFIKFNMRAISLQSQELKKLQNEQARFKAISAGKQGSSQAGGGIRKYIPSMNSIEQGNVPQQTLQEAARLQGTRSMTQMHANFRQILKQTAKEQHDQRKQETVTREKQDRANRHLHHITRKIPPRAETQLDRPQKERDYANLRQMHTSTEHTLLKKMVNQELESECKALIDLAERVGYLDPSRQSTIAMGKVPDTFTPSMKRSTKTLTQLPSEAELYKKTNEEASSLLQIPALHLSKMNNAGLNHHQRNRKQFSGHTTKNLELQLVSLLPPNGPNPAKPSSMTIDNEDISNIKSGSAALGGRFRQKRKGSIGMGLPQPRKITQSASLIQTLTQGNLAFQKQQYQRLTEGKRKTRHEIHANFHDGQLPPPKQNSYHKRSAQQVKFTEVASSAGDSGGVRRRVGGRESNLGIKQKPIQVESSESTPMLSIGSAQKLGANASSTKAFSYAKQVEEGWIKGSSAPNMVEDDKFFKSPSNSRAAGGNTLKSFIDTNLDRAQTKPQVQDHLTWSAVQNVASSIGNGESSGTTQRVQTGNMTERLTLQRADQYLGLMRSKDANNDLKAAIPSTTIGGKRHTAPKNVDISISPGSSSFNNSAARNHHHQRNQTQKVLGDQDNSSRGGQTSLFNGRMSQATTAMTPYTNTNTINDATTATRKHLRALQQHQNYLDQKESLLQARTEDEDDAADEEDLTEKLNISQERNSFMNGEVADSGRSSVNQNPKTTVASKQSLLITPNSKNARNDNRMRMMTATQQVFGEKKLSFLDKVKGDQMRTNDAYILQTVQRMKGQLLNKKAKTTMNAKQSAAVPVPVRKSQESLGVPNKEETSSRGSSRLSFTGLVDKSKMRQEREKNKVKQEKYEQKMKKLQSALRRKLQNMLNEEQMQTAITEFNIKEELKRRQKEEDRERRRQQRLDVSTSQAETCSEMDPDEYLREYLKQAKSMPRTSTERPKDLQKIATEVLLEDDDDDDDWKKVVTSEVDMRPQNKQINNRQSVISQVSQAGSKTNLMDTSQRSQKRQIRKTASVVGHQHSSNELLSSARSKNESRRPSINMQSTELLQQRLQDTQKRKQEKNKLKKVLSFQEKISHFRETVFSWVSEYVKEDGKKDFDAMAKLISDYEEQEDKGIIGWAVNRIKSISPTINAAEKKLNGVIDAVQYKYKRMMNFVLERNNFNQKDFMVDDVDDPIKFYSDEEQCENAVQNINYVHSKLEGVKELIMEKMLESIQKMFENFVREFTHDRDPLFDNKLIFYCILKTEGDILTELGDINKSIQAYKALRNYCRVWGMLEQEMWMAEQIGMCYRSIRYHELAVDYFKYQLSLAWELDQQEAEMRSYDNLSIEYYYVGNITKAKLYHERVFRGRVEQKDSTAKHASALLNHFNRNFKELKYAFTQTSLKGVSAEDKGKRANFGEYQKYIPKDEALSKKKQMKADVEKLKFENAIARDAAREEKDTNTDLLQNPTFTDLRSLTKEQKVIEKHKRAARRNFLIGSKEEQEKIRERYKPANLRGVVKLKTYNFENEEGSTIQGLLEENKHQSSMDEDVRQPCQTTEEEEEKQRSYRAKKLEQAKKALDDRLELEFRQKILKTVNRLKVKETQHQKIFYTHLSKSRRAESLKDKPLNQLRNCRQYLDFMESYIHQVIKEHNQKKQV